MIQVPIIDLGLSVNNMTKLNNQLFCRLDGLTPAQREGQRLEALSELGLSVSEAVPIFEETTQKAAAFSGAPISILSLAVKEELWFKSAVGLSSNGLTNQLAIQRKIALNESFGKYVIDSHQPLIINNALSSPVFATSILVQHYAIKTYLGVPLISSSGICVGILEVMDWVERQLDSRDLEHLNLLACWCLGEFERSQMLKARSNKSASKKNQPDWQQANGSMVLSNIGYQEVPEATLDSKSNVISNVIEQDRRVLGNIETNPIKIKLLSQLTQELRTPLTSVIGMASVLHQEVYGPLTIKQREYLEIIHNSGQNLISLVDEIVSLGVLSELDSTINMVAVDLEMLCQQVVNSLADLTKQHQQMLSLSLEPGSRIWSLDKEKIRQALYYLIVSILEMSEPGAEVKIHVSKRNKVLNIAVGVSHPWLGADFGQTKMYSQAITQALNLNQDLYRTRDLDPKAVNNTLINRQILTSSALMTVINDKNMVNTNTSKIPRDILGLLFCCHLTELHRGKVIVQGSPSSSFRYLLQFPEAKSSKE